MKSEIRILRTGTCPTLSGKSKLTYHVGCNDKSEILIRVHANSGSGYFNQEWIPLSAIQAALAKSPSITSFSLRSLYVGKSTNSPGFLLGVIKDLGMVKLKGEKERVYVAIDSKTFMAEIKTMLEAKVDAVATASTPTIKKASGSKSSPM